MLSCCSVTKVFVSEIGVILNETLLVSAKLVLKLENCLVQAKKNITNGRWNKTLLEKVISECYQ